MTGKSIRKIWHMVGSSFFPILSFFIPHQRLILLILIATLIFLFLDLLRLKNEAFNQLAYRCLKDFMKEKERKGLSGSSYTLISQFLCFYFIPWEIAVTSLFFLSFGDPFSALFEERLKDTSLINRKIKGFLASFIVCLLVGLFLKSIGLNLRLFQIIIGSFFASLPSIISLPPDDNITIPIFSSLSMTFSNKYDKVVLWISMILKDL